MASTAACRGTCCVTLRWKVSGGQVQPPLQDTSALPTPRQLVSMPRPTVTLCPLRSSSAKAPMRLPLLLGLMCSSSSSPGVALAQPHLGCCAPGLASFTHCQLPCRVWPLTRCPDSKLFA